MSKFNNILVELNSDSQSEPFILNESVLALNRLWMNESNSPDILTYNDDLIRPLMNDLKAQQVLALAYHFIQEDEDDIYEYHY